ncbi:MAG: sulfate/thiosulfate transport system substrate-binding protein [Pseudonocardiales bacterium]|nr:sulfate/thiosulfate transport system substrate-binding protein [Pseudonocardiales bacterium]MDT4941101.1 sulfate/thiosulfate transport system substrate-binding protein [Pseudonocardiales bacterium]
MSTSISRTRRFAAVAAAAVAVVVGVSACSSSSGGKSINLVAYSVPKPAYDALSAAFAKTDAGKDFNLKPSYGPSGTQRDAVLAGQAADLVNFSTGADMSALVPDKVAKGWDSGPSKGIIADSVVAIVVRPGNPLGITGWDDLTKSGVEIVTPDPASSGSAKWNLLAAYEHVISQGGSAADAEQYLKDFFGNVVSRASSGSDAMQQFLNGTGNVLISYEAEAIAARQAGEHIDYVIPDQNILIQTPAAVTKDGSQLAKDFLDYAESDAGQQIFASKGFRPVSSSTQVGTVEGANDPSNPYPTPKDLVTIDDLGGWDVVNDKFFGDTGIVTKIESS